jgi:branched-chain amino acid transport system substrate-binding protein
MVIVSPAGVRWMRPEDHQSMHEAAIGRVSNDVINIGGEMSLVSEIVTLPPLLLFRSMPDYVSPLVKYKIPLTGYEHPVKVR